MGFETRVWVGVRSRDWVHGQVSRRGLGLGSGFLDGDRVRGRVSGSGFGTDGGRGQVLG